MIVSTYQPFFSPFPAFFYKAHLSDLLVILDAVQFPRGTTWISRNRFKNDQGTLWVTIPVWKKGLGLQKINQVRICYERAWERKHLASLKSAYTKAPYWREHNNVVEAMFSGRFERLVELNLMIIEYLKKYLGIDTPLMVQSDLGIHAQGNELLIQICRKVGATHYLAQDGASILQAARSCLSAALGQFHPRPFSVRPPF
jgi:hypothetical protein